ncbi:MAG: aminopeptidase P family protein [Chlorobium sp.]|nr:aminopeptidase P family protein [Chlorobium sp.]
MQVVTDPVRRETLLRLIKASGLQALLAWYPEDLVMMTGTWPCLGMNLCLYPLEGDPLYYLSDLEPEDVSPPGFIIRRFAVDTEKWADLRSALESDVRRLGLKAEEIGIALDGGQHAATTFSGETPPFGALALTTILDGLRVRDATALFTAAGLRKTPREIERIRRANTVAGVGLTVFHEVAQPGRTEAEIAALVEGAIQSYSGRDGCSLARAWAQVQAGRNTFYGGTFSRSSAYRVAEGDLVLLELATCVDGYWSDLTRTSGAGKVGDRKLTLLKTVQDAQEAAIAAVRPGITHGEIDHIARQWLEERGFGAGFRHNTGHQVGFRYHDRGPTLQKGSTAVLEAGMVITVEPGCYGAAFDGGARFEDNILVDSAGAIMLSPHHIRWQG